MIVNNQTLYIDGGELRYIDGDDEITVETGWHPRRLTANALLMVQYYHLLSLRPPRRRSLQIVVEL